jgi:hypothetical protein
VIDENFGNWGFTWVSLDAVGGSLNGRVILGAD